MAKKNVTVLFDRAGRAQILGKGKVEIRVYLSRTVRKYIVLGECTPKGWKFYQNSKELKKKCEEYEEAIPDLVSSGLVSEKAAEENLVLRSEITRLAEKVAYLECGSLRER